jgi:hypothetical protein
MTARVVIRAHGSRVASLVAAAAFGGLAVAGLWIGSLAISLGEGGLWVWSLVSVGALLLWGVIHALWAAFGVVLILSERGVRKVGAFGGLSLSREDLRIGRYDTWRSNFRGGGEAQGALRAVPWTQFWALPAGGKAVLLWEGPQRVPQADEIAEAVPRVLGLSVEIMAGERAAGFSD